MGRSAREIAERLHAVIADHGAEAVLPFSDAGNQGLLAMMGIDARFFQHLGAPSCFGHLRPHGRRRDRMTNGTGRSIDGLEFDTEADPLVGDEHAADQPSPVADHRTGSRAGRPPRGHRPDPHRHC